jgi:hypothetical protein
MLDLTKPEGWAMLPIEERALWLKNKVDEACSVAIPKK